MEFKGKIVWIGDLQNVGPKQTPKVEFAVQQDETEQNKYPDGMVFTLFGDPKANILSTGGFKVNDYVDVGYNSKISEYKEKRFMNTNAWKVTKQKSIDPTQEAGPDDLPF